PPLQRVEVDPCDLDDLRAGAAGHLVDLTEPRDLVGGRDAPGGALGPVRPATETVAQIDDRAGSVAAERGACGRGRLDQGVAIEPVRVGVAVGRALCDADAGAPVEPGRQLLDPAVVQPDRRGRALLDEDLREVAALAPS